MGAPFITALSDKDLRTLTRFLRGGAEINERRAQELLEG